MTTDIPRGPIPATLDGFRPYARRRAQCSTAASGLAACTQLLINSALSGRPRGHGTHRHSPCDASPHPRRRSPSGVGTSERTHALRPASQTRLVPRLATAQIPCRGTFGPTMAYVAHPRRRTSRRFAGRAGDAGPRGRGGRLGRGRRLSCVAGRARPPRRAGGPGHRSGAGNHRGRTARAGPTAGPTRGPTPARPATSQGRVPPEPPVIQILSRILDRRSRRTAADAGAMIRWRSLGGRSR
jgi:hypothetical protein